MSVRSAFSQMDRAVALICVACLLAASSVLVVRDRTAQQDPPLRAAADAPAADSAPVSADPSPPAPDRGAPGTDVLAPDRVGAVTTLDEVAIRAEPVPDAPEVSRLRAGILLPVTGFADGHFAVLTPCEIRGWVPAERVRTHPMAAGEPTALHEATIVLDPGHGGIMSGAPGPTGLSEAQANSAIVAQLTELLAGPRRIEASGAVVPGSDHGPPRVLLTRSEDYTTGLGFRATVANSVGAHVLLSIHNNASPDSSLTGPGTEIFYQLDSPASKRLSGLLYEEVTSTLRRYDVPWVGNRDAGVKYRRGSDGDDYYGILRRPEVTAALLEAMFISNPAEEDLLKRPDVQRAIAEAVYRALVRYVTTQDPGSGFVDPIPRAPGPSGQLHSACTDPA